MTLTSALNLFPKTMFNEICYKVQSHWILQKIQESWHGYNLSRRHLIQVKEDFLPWYWQDHHTVIITLFLLQNEYDIKFSTFFLTTENFRNYKLSLDNIHERLKPEPKVKYSISEVVCIKGLILEMGFSLWIPLIYFFKHQIKKRWIR
jgi:hypothetical protein